MNKLILTTLAAATVMAAPAYAYGDVEYARVVSAEPVYQQVRIASPQQECHDERVVYQQPVYQRGNNPGGALFGAIIGGVIGHQFGGGAGNAVMTATGAVVGAGIGQGTPAYAGTTERVAYEPHCVTYNDYRTEDRVAGYDVTYRYNGRLYHTRMDHDPGSHVPVQVDVNPVRGY